MDAARMRVGRARRLARDVKERERVAARGELDGARAQERARALLAGHGGVARVVWSAIARGWVTVARSFWQSCGSARHYVVLLEPALHGAPRRRPGPPPSGRGRALDGSPTVVVTLTPAPDLDLDPVPDDLALDLGVDFGGGVDVGGGVGVGAGPGPAGSVGGSVGWVLVSAVRVVLPAPIPQVTGDVAVLAGWLGLTVADLVEITAGDPVLLAELAASGSVTGAAG